MLKRRLDHELVNRKLAQTRSQAESYVRMGAVKVDGKIVQKAGLFVTEASQIELGLQDKYVSRAAYKLESADKKFRLKWHGATVLDVGSSTGGFTDYALQHGAAKVVAVDVGKDQLHPSLRVDSRIERHEKTDIRDFAKKHTGDERVKFEYIVIDVSFISLQEILPHVAKLADAKTRIVAMCKPQFETGHRLQNKGVIKNDTMRRHVLKHFEDWAKRSFVILDKADSAVTGSHGNRERFYLLAKQNQR